MGDAEPTSTAPFLQFDDFLGEAEVDTLINFVREHESDLGPSSVLAAPGDVAEEIRRSRTMHALDAIWPMFEEKLAGLLPVIRNELGEPWFELAHIERQLTVHHDGDFFGIHNDNGGSEVESRRLTYVYYFHVEPKSFEGGDLWMYDFYDEGGWRHRGEDHAVVEPRNDSIVFFPSWVHHEVRPVTSQTESLEGWRMTLNGWFHTHRSDAEPDAPIAVVPSEADEGL